ncbi:universal stress protein [Bacillus badius]|uniref:Universal stress protein n=1 Tax=Bacillus badius TaxID=1455 RepID=A0ABR5AX86_BACBA|nr:universal stress protein [Bacillus badius]KIL76088.1 Universal stress protein family [Bacillus badius]KIL79349.1 Universal stress protein family [Bacillus badius]KZR59717.1 universal stress protein UspA [Bacillus badius]MED4716531.1 universal stress protein [Bacillus badius]
MDMTYKNILIAVDGSDEAKRGLEKAVEIAKRNEAALHIVHIVDNGYFASVEALAHASIPDYNEKQGEKLLAEYKEAAEAAGAPSVHTIMETGSPKALIPNKIADQAQADLIICGATGIHGMERVFLGSVSERITRTAKCDVLIVRN